MVPTMLTVATEPGHSSQLDPASRKQGKPLSLDEENARSIRDRFTGQVKFSDIILANMTDLISTDKLKQLGFRLRLWIEPRLSFLHRQSTLSPHYHLYKTKERMVG